MWRENFYAVLGLQNFSAMDSVNKRYRTLALKYHPDRGGDMDMMKRLNAAYNVLKSMKDRYDGWLQAQRAPEIEISFVVHGSVWSNDTTATTASWSFM